MEKNDLKNMIKSIDLQSSVKEQGEYVTQIIHFVGGDKRTYDGIIADSIRQGHYTIF